jgi:hypothetical protein
MYLNAERIAVANKALRDTFEQTSVAWQAIPHWDTGDPGQIRVRLDDAYAPEVDGLAPPIPGGSLEIETMAVRFAVTVAQATAPTPDPLLAAVIARTVQLSGRVDRRVVVDLLNNDGNDITTPSDVQSLLNAFIDARAKLEKAGYRAPSCLLTDTAGVRALNVLLDGLSEVQPILDAADINSLYRLEEFDAKDTGAVGNKGKGAQTYTGKMILLGRRQRIAHGGAAATTPGEEPMDLAVSLPPSLEVVGETDKGDIEMLVRIRFVPRLTDKNGVVRVVIS